MVGKAITVFEKRGSEFEINHEILTQLFRKVGDRTLAVYSINGRSRTGKSFMFNYILKYLLFGNDRDDWAGMELSHEFLSKGGSLRQTTGVQVWSEPLFVKCGEEEIGIILLDGQGLFDDETSMEDNTRIFAFNSVFSSVLIFNAMNQMEEIHWQFLDSLLSYSDLCSGEDCAVESYPSKRLHLINRDWYWGQDYGYGTHDPELNLSPPGRQGNLIHKYFPAVNNEAADEIESTRNGLRSRFANISATVLPHPGNLLASENDPDVNSWDPEFLKHLKEFVTFFLSPKFVTSNRMKIGRLVISGNDMVALVTKWGDLFCNSEIPKSESLFQVAAKQQFETKLETVKEKFTTEMNSKMSTCPDGMQNFDSLASQLKKETLDSFQTSKLLGWAVFGLEYLELLGSRLDSLISDSRTVNSKKLESARLREKAEKGRLEAARIKEEFDKKVAAEEKKRRDDKAEFERRQAQIIRDNEALRIRLEQQERQRIATIDTQTGAAMTAAYQSQGRNITVTVSRNNGQISYNYTINGGTVRSSELQQPIGNLNINNAHFIIN